MIAERVRPTHRASLSDHTRAGLLALLPVLGGLIGLGSLAAHHGDEAYYIQGAAHMLETGNYLVPVYHGELVLERAPLCYWLIALSFRLFGMSLFTARLPSLLAAGLVAATVYWFALRVYGSGRGASYAALAMAFTPVTCFMSRLAIPDMVMTVGVFLGVACYYIATVTTHRRLSLFVASVGVGIAGMAKGHVGIVVGLLPLFALVVFGRRLGCALPLRFLVSPATWLPAVVLCGWWYAFLLMSDHRVIDFVPQYRDPRQTVASALVVFLRSEVEHQADAGWGGLQKNLQRYSLGLVAWFLPWSLYILAGLFRGQRVLRAEWTEHPGPTNVLLTAMVSITLFFTFFVLEVRSLRYVLPIAPAVAVLAGRCCLRREESREHAPRVPAPVAIGAGMLFLSALFFGVVLPAVVHPPIQSLCVALEPRLGPSDTVLTGDIGGKWTTFAMVLLGRPVRMLDSSGKAWMDALPRDPGGGAVYLLTTPAFADRLQQEQPDRFRIIGKEDGTTFFLSQPTWEPLEMLEMIRTSPVRSG